MVANKSFYFNEETAARLQAGIVKQACDDYIRAKRELLVYEDEDACINHLLQLKSTNGDIQKANKIMTDRVNRANKVVIETTAFFKSEWYRLLCTLDVDWLIGRLNEEVYNV